MQHSRVIPCEACDDQKRKLEEAHFVVLGCAADPNDPGFCIIRFNDPDAAELRQIKSSNATGNGGGKKPGKRKNEKGS